MKRLSIVCLLLLVLPCMALAQLPDTGQTKCYNNSAEMITCPSPGEDFYGQDAHYVINPQSYTTLGGGIMVKDNVTGLIWEVKQDKDDIQNYENPHDADNTYTWYDGDTGTPGDGESTYDTQQHFIDVLNVEEFGGFSNWRLPTYKELSFIVNRGTFNPSIDTGYFPNTVPDLYWSSTNDAFHSPDRPKPWYVNFKDGFTFRFPTTESLHVRAVCGEQFVNNFIDNGDGTTTDANTGLMWQRGSTVSIWKSALSYCESIALAGYDDWRLPSIHELLSIIDHNQPNCRPHIDTDYFSPCYLPPPYTCQYDHLCWTSTTDTANPEDAWFVCFEDGDYLSRGKNETMYARCVRGGFDFDNDGIFDDDDNCPYVANPEQTDADGDCIGNACDPDDSDPNNPTTLVDSDSDGIGDVCDLCPNDSQNDIDNDSVCGDIDNCPGDYNPLQEDADSDGIGDVCDNCLDVYNPDQEDTYPPDGNGCGDACECEGDFDGDGDVDDDDIANFQASMGRFMIYRPCAICISGSSIPYPATNGCQTDADCGVGGECAANPSDPCYGDFDCDGDVKDGDIDVFQADMYRTDCPTGCPFSCEY